MNKKEKIQKIENALRPLKGIGVMLETFAKMLITVMTLYAIGLRVGLTLSTFQVLCINLAMLYWIMTPLFRYVKEVFWNGR